MMMMMMMMMISLGKIAMALNAMGKYQNYGKFSVLGLRS